MSAGSVAAQATGTPGVNNTAWLFFVLVLAFLFFVTVRGDLPKWLGLLGLGGSPKTGAAPTPAPAGDANFLGGALPDVLSGQHAGLPPLPAIPGGGTYSASGGGV